MKSINKFYPYLLAILGFVVISLIYFYPVLQGKQIYQSDIVQYTGMAKEQNDFRKATGEEPYWTNSAFGGMPTYQLGANYPHNYIKQFDYILRFLPRPADYLFLYFLGFFVLMRVLKIDPLKAFFGALAFGFSTYLIIILGVGHNAKAHAIAYMPMVVAGVILVFQKRYIAGGLLTMVAAALEINANHFQMTYYLLLLLIVIGIYFAIQIIKSKEFKHLGTSIGVFIIAAVLAVGANAASLMATAEYADFSTRSKSELRLAPDGSPKESTNAMSYEYITEYSYGIFESFNLIAPRISGGSGNESLAEDSHMVDALQSMQIGEGQYMPQAQAVEIAKSGMPTYWGDQPIVAAPAYIGAIVFFLFVLAMFTEKRKIKYAFLAGAILALLLSWGKHFAVLTDFFINYVPMYNKFRAVASIQVLLELCMPVLAVMGLYSFFKTEKEEQWQSLWKAGAISLGTILLLLLVRGQLSFSGARDEGILQSYGPDFLAALKDDRRAMYSSDLFRSFMLILAAAAVLWMFIKQKMSKNYAVIAVGLLMVLDLFFVDKKYVDSENFVTARQVDRPFEPTNADIQIANDTSHYRVLDLADPNGPLNSSRTSFFHSSIGGYHAAKPRKIQQLFDYQIAKNNIDVLNMLNVKYIIQNTEDGMEVPTVNPDANGNAWFVNRVTTVDTPDDAMKKLAEFDSKKEAFLVGNNNKAQKRTFVVDSTAAINAVVYEPNYIKYNSNNASDGFAVFSEIYYANGWNAYIDGKLAPHYEVNYVLRGINIPAGKHIVEFKFEPQVVQTGGTVSLISCILILLLIAGGVYAERKNSSATRGKDA